MMIILYVFLGLIVGYKIAEAIYKNNMSFSARPTKKQASTFQAPSLLEDKMWYESETEFIFKFNEMLSLTLEREKVVKCIIEAAYNFLPVERSVLLLWDKDAQRLKIEGAMGWLMRDSKEYTFLKSADSISMSIIHRKEPLVVNDLEKEFYLKKINKEEYLKKSFISVPLIFQKEALGVLHFCDKKSDAAFTERDKLFAVNIGRISAIALQNVQMYEQIQSNYLKTITALALAVDARDNYTKYHSENVAKYAVAIAEEMKCNDYEVELIKRSSLLHDIGKIGVKDAILLKKSKLTFEEFEDTKLHPVKGEEIVKIIPFLKEASVLIRHHHERYDGLGYPDGLKGPKIEFGARILAVADAFDAMITERPYRKALSNEEALQELEINKGVQFDPKVVECLQAVLKKNPSVLQPA